MAAILLAVGSVALMGSVAGAPPRPHLRPAEDPLAEVWRLAQFDRGEIGLVGDDVSHQANAPSGVHLRRPVDASQVLDDAPASILARLLGPVLAYNVLVFLAFWTAGLAAYGAMRWLGAGIWGSATAAALFTAAPVHVIEAQLHVGLALVFMLPLLAALGVRALLRPSVRRGAVFGGGVALCGDARATSYSKASCSQPA